MKKKVIAFLYFIALSTTLSVNQAYSQGQKEEKFTNLGPIAISDKYVLPENRRAIIFRIKNNSSRSISQIYGRVFMIKKIETDPNKRFLLINNPHKGGNILKGKPHRPGTISEWNFTLMREPLIANQNIEYTLQVHPRSIFYANIETNQKSNKAKDNP